jgi:D-sedoheptulose 7-phosphate isomerase
LSAKLIQENISTLRELLLAIESSTIAELARQAELLAEKLATGHSVLWCGNGGSAAESQHMAAELMGRFKLSRPAMSSIALTTDTSALTAIGNDFDFNDVFKRQVEGIGRSGDTLVVYTTSGNSANILRAVDAAKSLGMFVIGFLAGDGGEAAKIVDFAVVAPTYDTPRAQEIHTLLGHSFCQIIEKKFHALKQ